MRATTRLCATPKRNLYEANRVTHRLITEGFFLTREDSSLPDLYIRPIDWKDEEANAFCLVTQLEVQGMEFHRTDGVLYVNCNVLELVDNFGFLISFFFDKFIC